MVVICKESYPDDLDVKYGDSFATFPYALSPFQKHSIQAIVDGNHSLVTAHTGSGKTVPIEFAIQHFISRGKRVVYLGPLKSLVDQKYYTFGRQFPDITFGIMTGDIKYQPNAQVLVMTAEIFMNYLFHRETNTQRELSFDLDLENDLGCVVFDEVHFILDEQRGHVWEKIMLMLPKYVQLIMLSATLQDPLKLASFIENRHASEDTTQVVLSSTSERIVPLTHYGFMTTTESIFKKCKDKETQKLIRSLSNTLILLKTEKGIFQEEGHKKLKTLKTLLDNNNVFIKRDHVLNTLVGFMVEKEMLPAIIFSFSRSAVESCAAHITTNILEFDSKIPYTARREAEQIVRKLPNYQEYMALPEYETLIRLLEKGVAIHHSGMLPILREIVELFIDRKLVKLLFATDSFSVGLNCPIRTVCFTGLRKFDGKMEQWLAPHLYSQCAGRAGRRGIDTLGNVIHCNNLFELPGLTDYRKVMCGKPQLMESKFSISYDIILNLIGQGKNAVQFISKSMMNDEVNILNKIKEKELVALQNKLDIKNTLIFHAPIEILEEYHLLCQQLPTLVNKKRKDVERRITCINVMYDTKASPLLKESEYYHSMQSLKKEVQNKKVELCDSRNTIENQVQVIMKILDERGFIVYDTEHDGGQEKNECKFTSNGRIASGIAEVPALVFVEWMTRMNDFQDFPIEDIIGILSCFTNVRVKDEYRITSPEHVEHVTIKRALQVLQTIIYDYQDLDDFKQDIVLTYDLIQEVISWSLTTEETVCKKIVQIDVLGGKEISLGDFTKAVLKICTIARELKTVCESEGKVELAHKLNQIDTLMLKYVCSNQSLYV